MGSEILKLASGQGFYAILFVGLILYVLRETRTREENYRVLIEKLGNVINEDLQQIKSKIDNLM